MASPLSSMKKSRAPPAIFFGRRRVERVPILASCGAIAGGNETISFRGMTYWLAALLACAGRWSDSVNRAWLRRADFLDDCVPLQEDLGLCFPFWDGPLRMHPGGHRRRIVFCADGFRRVERGTPSIRQSARVVDSRHRANRRPGPKLSPLRRGRLHGRRWKLDVNLFGA